MTLQLLQQILQSINADVTVVAQRVRVQKTLGLLRPPPVLRRGADQVRRGQEEDAAGCQSGKLRRADREGSAAPPAFLQRVGGAVADELVNGAVQITLNNSHRQNVKKRPE